MAAHSRNRRPAGANVDGKLGRYLSKEIGACPTQMADAGTDEHDGKCPTGEGSLAIGHVILQGR